VKLLDVLKHNLILDISEKLKKQLVFKFSADTQDKLREWGYTIKPSRLANHLAAIMVGGSRLSEIKPNSSALFGANDPRRNTGLALGY
jgi:gamma-glutamyltranspeptidase/glutathione hydrolase